MGMIISSLLCYDQSLKDEAEKAVEQLQEAEAETKSLRTMIHRTMLTHEEMVCSKTKNRIMCIDSLTPPSLFDLTI